jgi:hypothetical protein
MDGPRVATIVRPDSQHEITEINREFKDGIDPATGKKGKTNSIMLGEYSLRVKAGPSTEDRTDQATEALTEVFQVAPNLLNAPGVAPRFLRMVGRGTPQVEDIADSLMGNQGGEQSPEQLQGQLLQLQQSDQAKTILIQKMQQALQAKLPDLEVRKWEAAVKAVTQIRVAEINASKDADNQKADLDASRFEAIMSMAHETAMQQVDHSHEADQAQAAAQNAQQQQQQQEAQPTQ